MAGMNWDRVKRQDQMWAAADYSARMDEMDRQIYDRHVRKPTEDDIRSPKGSKAARALAEAQRLGISVQELKKLRQAEAKRNDELARRAKELGVSVKQLRKSESSPRPVGRPASTRAPSRLAGTPRKSPGSAKKRSVKPAGAPPPVSTKERLRREAEAKGVSLQVHMASLLPPGGRKSSDSTSRPARPSTVARTAAQRSDSVQPVQSAKRQRDEQEAQRRGITIAQLRAARREDQVLRAAINKEAKSLGVSAKELKRQRGLH